VSSAVPWSAVAGVILDVDGTLYDQAGLRRRMALELLRHHATRPWRLGDLRVLAAFRSERERRALVPETGLAHAQFRWAAEATGAPPERVRALVERWMDEAPLRHLPALRRPGVAEFLAEVAARRMKSAVFSDYPAQAKLAAMGLRVDAVVTALDPDVDRLKPDPTGLVVAARRLGLPVDRCLFIGDRDDRDGAAARGCGMPYRLLAQASRGSADSFASFLDLLAELRGVTPGPFTRA
jgi:phosphoglycolate phosphatase/putative hydrolase of the HAD superfamily